eukprot:7385364-Pyramimonas_sp.AAC.1
MTSSPTSSGGSSGGSAAGCCATCPRPTTVRSSGTVPSGTRCAASRARSSLERCQRPGRTSSPSLPLARPRDI